jgi:hypothetical protein
MEISFGMSESAAADPGWRGTDEGYQIKSTYDWNDNANGSNSWYRALYDVDYDDVYRDETNRSYGFSARCVRD